MRAMVLRRSGSAWDARSAARGTIFNNSRFPVPIPAKNAPIVSKNARNPVSG